MKGIVFTEFMEMVETRFSPEMLDDIIEDADLPHGGAYTSVGTYDHAEMVRLVEALSEHTGNPVRDLIQSFGHHLFDRFHVLYPHFFKGMTNALEFLLTIEDVIHVEVLKLYPDAQLPRFECVRHGPALEMVYHSPRHFDDLALGLIEGAIAHWGGSYTVSRTLLPTGQGVRFMIEPEAAAQ
jgi:hypothetical protein